MVLPTSVQIYNTYSEYFALRYSSNHIEDNLRRMNAFISDKAELIFQNTETRKWKTLIGKDAVLLQLKRQMPADHRLIKVAQEYDKETAETHSLYESPLGEKVVCSEIYTITLEDDRCMITKIKASSRILTTP